MVRQLIDQNRRSEFKPWEMPVTQFNGLHPIYRSGPRAQLHIVKDYDDYVARLDKVPLAFQQITTTCDGGIDDHRVPPKYLLEKVLVAGQRHRWQTAGGEPLRAAAQEISRICTGAAEQARIRKKFSMPSRSRSRRPMSRFGRFLRETYIPAGRTDPGIWSLPTATPITPSCVKESTTTDLTPAQIHEMGLEQVEEDEAATTGPRPQARLHRYRRSAGGNQEQSKTASHSRPINCSMPTAGYRPDAAKASQLFGRLPKAALVVEASTFVHGEGAGRRPTTTRAPPTVRVPERST